jgi:hypothetical protein
LFFKKALEDYRYLRERDYPEKASLALVGNRYRLSRLQRNCLFRGVQKSAVARARRGKLVDPRQVRGRPVAVDWYNVLITVESYLKGLPVFVADDGLLRDASGVHGSYRMGKTGERAVALIVESLRELEAERIDVYVDSPVAFSGEMASLVRGLLSDRPGEVAAARSADYLLKRHRGIVCSSDSVVVDQAAAVFDLSREVVERKLGRRVPDMDGLGGFQPES